MLPTVIPDLLAHVPVSAPPAPTGVPEFAVTAQFRVLPATVEPSVMLAPPEEMYTNKRVPTANVLLVGIGWPPAAGACHVAAVEPVAVRTSPTDGAAEADTPTTVVADRNAAAADVTTLHDAAPVPEVRIQT